MKKEKPYKFRHVPAVTPNLTHVYHDGEIITAASFHKMASLCYTYYDAVSPEERRIIRQRVGKL